MSDTDEMTIELREHVHAMSVPAPPLLAAITARGRTRRRHRRLGAVGLSTASVVAAAMIPALTGAARTAQAPVADRTTASAVGIGAHPTIRTTAFTLVRHPDGTVTLTIDPAELFDPAALENDLAKDGIPAQVTPGKICTSDPAPGYVSQVVVWHSAAQTGDGDTITIDPSAIPAGAELSFGTVPLRGSEPVQAAQFTLVDPNAVTCGPNAITGGPGQPDHGGGFEIGPTN